MRRTAAVLVVVLGLTACGDGDEPSTDPAPDEPTAETETSGAPTMESAPDTDPEANEAAPVTAVGGTDGGFVVIVNGAVQTSTQDLCASIPGGVETVNIFGDGWNAYLETGEDGELDFDSDELDVTITVAEGASVTGDGTAFLATAPLPDGGSIEVSGICSS